MLESMTVVQLAEFAAGVERILAVMFGDLEFSILAAVGPRAEQIVVQMDRHSNTFRTGISFEALADPATDSQALVAATAYQLHLQWDKSGAP